MNPFDKIALSELLQSIDTNPLRLVSRENSILEFKQSFGWKSMPSYSKTFAAFANAGGGYIVFGVKNSPHDIVGLQNTLFDDIDPAKMTQFLNEHYSSEIRWEKTIVERSNKKVGIIYISESMSKPIICTKNDSDDIRESDIYYRYRGRSERIRYPELSSIIEKEKREERIQWMAFLRKIAKVDIKKLAILELEKGEISDSSKSYVIPQELLTQIKFVKDGHFVEKLGSPALRMLGDAHIVGSNTVIKESHIPKSIRMQDIIENFLGSKKVQNPIEFIIQACHEQSPYLPVRYYVAQCKEKKERILEEVKLEKDVQSSQRDGIICRIEGKKIPSIGSLKNDTPASKQRHVIFESLCKKAKIEVTKNNYRKVCEAITHLNASQIQAIEQDIKNYLKQMWDWRKEIEDMDLTTIRKTMCYIDNMA